MFDPSKLDLNVDENSEKNEDTKVSMQENDVVSHKETNPKEDNQELVIEDKDIKDPLSEVGSSEKNEDTKVAKQENELDSSKDKENINQEEEKNKILFDINIDSLSSVLGISIKNEYDFISIEPNQDSVEIAFIKDKVKKEVRHIKFPNYSNILAKLKSTCKLDSSVTNEHQEGVGEIELNQHLYKVMSKVSPSNLGEKLLIKTSEIEKKIVKKEVKKTPASALLGFIGAVAFISLVLGGAFIGFVVMNAQTVEDVRFFTSLGINLDEINRFIGQALSIIFSILIFVEIAFLVVYLFKFTLTKKIFKQKKIKYGVLSTLLLIICFITASIWMVFQQKVDALPDWQNKARGEIQLYDNYKLSGKDFDKATSIIFDTTNLIGPVEIKFDLNVLMENEEKKGLSIKKYIWDFGDGEKFESSDAIAIKEYAEKGTYDIGLTLLATDFNGETVERIVDNIPTINITNLVTIEERKLNSGGALIRFDASDLSKLGKVLWYDMDKYEIGNPVYEGYEFQVQKPAEEKLYGIFLERNDRVEEGIDKFFIIKPDEETSLGGRIEFTRQIENDLEYELKVVDAENDFGNGIIESFIWKINDEEITVDGDIDNPTEASKILYTFKSYGEKQVEVTLINSIGEEKTLDATIDIPRKISLKSPLKIYNDGDEIDEEELEYNEKTNDYYINSIDVPTTLKLDARFVRSADIKYTLDKVNWDFNSDGDNDESAKLVNHEISVEGNTTITVEYIFKHRQIKDEEIILEQKIHIEGVRKEASLKLDIIKDRDYTPVIVKFDASRSQVKNENISKFVWDFGDGTSQDGDAVISGHKYTEPGDYLIKLKVVTESGKEYFKEEKLILKPTPQVAKMKTSFKKTNVNQTIDFSSKESSGQIISYFWKFGDGNSSFEANPSHSYSKPGIYEVVLVVEFENKNVQEDKMDIEIVDN